MESRGGAKIEGGGKEGRRRVELEGGRGEVEGRGEET